MKESDLEDALYQFHLDDEPDLNIRLKKYLGFYPQFRKELEYHYVEILMERLRGDDDEKEDAEPISKEPSRGVKRALDLFKNKLADLRDKPDNQDSFQVFVNIVKSLADIEKEWGLAAEVLQKYTHYVSQKIAPAEAFYHACCEWDV